MGYFGPLGPAGFRRRGRRRGLAVGLMVGSAMGRGEQANAAAQQQSGAGKLTDESALEKLSQLHEAGILTDVEFEAKKKQVLGE
ncbi:SHOCT domain-containing protein [Culicoidibacter larvae]|uniref:SHOCT domain-containing protein n=1 Tax=Culicoidibacter larvae TaxID=2579976 RepID=A0A5R8Q835_9FIRM|nr:SHOCT domain-containing protein [Culicoidibacter larvae]TLG71217.1 SHOCT domain-containing protein [Culicoidibacter larvae]